VGMHILSFDRRGCYTFSALNESITLLLKISLNTVIECLIEDRIVSMPFGLSLNALLNGRSLKNLSPHDDQDATVTAH
jgi:hypothetical protein